MQVVHVCNTNIWRDSNSWLCFLLIVSLAEDDNAALDVNLLTEHNVSSLHIISNRLPASDTSHMRAQNSLH